MLPIKILRKIFSVRPREHIYIVQRGTGVETLIEQIVVGALVISPSDRNQYLCPASVIVSGTIGKAACLRGRFCRLCQGVFLPFI